jgi:hypothetical protein
VNAVTEATLPTLLARSVRNPARAPVKAELCRQADRRKSSTQMSAFFGFAEPRRTRSTLYCRECRAKRFALSSIAGIHAHR